MSKGQIQKNKIAFKIYATLQNVLHLETEKRDFCIIVYSLKVIAAKNFCMGNPQNVHNIFLKKTRTEQRFKQLSKVYYCWLAFIIEIITINLKINKEVEIHILGIHYT